MRSSMSAWAEITVTCPLTTSTTSCLQRSFPSSLAAQGLWLWVGSFKGFLNLRFAQKDSTICQTTETRMFSSCLWQEPKSVHLSRRSTIIPLKQVPCFKLVTCLKLTFTLHRFRNYFQNQLKISFCWLLRSHQVFQSKKPLLLPTHPAYLVDTKH